MAFFSIEPAHVIAGIAACRKKHAIVPAKEELLRLALLIQQQRASLHCPFGQALHDVLDAEEITEEFYRASCKTALGALFNARKTTARPVEEPPEPEEVTMHFPKPDPYNWDAYSANPLMHYNSMRQMARQRRDDLLLD